MRKDANNNCPFGSKIIETIILSALFLLPPTSYLFAQRIIPSFETLNVNEGLTQSSVYAIHQDRFGYMWVGTADGLNRYDGAHFNVYNHNIDKIENSIGSNVIQAISEDQNGNIWINTIGGISRYQKTTGKFFRYFYKNTTAKKVTENEYKLAINAKGEVFCYAADGILSKYDPNSDKFITYQKFASNNGIIKMQFSQNQLWYLTKKENLVLANPTAAGLKVVRSFKLDGGITNFFVVNKQIILSLNNDNHFQYLLIQNQHQPQDLTRVFLFVFQ